MPFDSRERRAQPPRVAENYRNGWPESIGMGGRKLSESPVEGIVRFGTHRLSGHVMVYDNALSGLVGNRPSGHSTFDEHDQHATILERLDWEATAGGGGRS